MNFFYNIVRGLLTLYYAWKRRRLERKRCQEAEAHASRQISDVHEAYWRKRDDLEMWRLRRIEDILYEERL